MRIDLPGARVERTSDGYAFLFDPHYGFAYLLNETGAVLATMLLISDHGEEELVAAIRHQFELPSDATPKEDVRLFLNRMRYYGLMV